MTRLQWLARSTVWLLATCPACGAHGHGRLTEAVTILLLTVALQVGVAHVVPNPRFWEASFKAPFHPPRFAALAMEHLVRVHVSGFSKPDPLTPTHSLGSIMLMRPQCADMCELLGETVPAMR